MEGPVNKYFKSRSSPTPSESGESNENELNHDEMISKLGQTPKKSATKHFMSPTISASTKARKKILTERNESVELIDANVPKTLKFRSSSSRVTKSQSFASASDDEDEYLVLRAPDSSLKPYDPVTNYTSPRPKFLRYNPNRSVSHNETLKEHLGFEARRRMCFDSQRAAEEEREEKRAIASSLEIPRIEDLGFEARRRMCFDSQRTAEEEREEKRAIASSLESRIEDLGFEARRTMCFDSQRAAEEEREEERAIASALESPRKEDTSIENQDSHTSPRPKFIRYTPNRSVSQNETPKEDLGFEARRRMCFDSQRAAEEEREEARAIASSLKSPRKADTSNEKLNSNLEEEDEDDDVAEDIEKKEGWGLKDVLKFLLVVAVLFISIQYISSMNSEVPSPTVQALRGIKNGYYEVHNKVFEAVNLKILQVSNADVELAENRAKDENDRPLEGGKENIQVENQPDIEHLEDLSENKPGKISEVIDQVGEVTEIVEDEFDQDLDLLDLQPEDMQVEDLSGNEMGTISEEFDQVDEVTEIVEDEFDHELESAAEESDHLVDEVYSDIKEGVFGSVELLDTETVVVEEVAENEEIVYEIASRNVDRLGTTDGLKPDSEYASLEPQGTVAFAKFGVPVIFSIIIASLGLVYLWRCKKNSTEFHEVRSAVVEKNEPVTIKNVEFKAKPAVLICSNKAEKSEEFQQSQAPIVELLSELVIGDAISSHKSKFSYTTDSYSEEFSTAESVSYGSFSTPVKKISKKANDEGMTPVRRSSRIRNRAIMSP